MKRLLALLSLATVPFFTLTAEEAGSAADYDAKADRIQNYIAAIRGELSAGKVQSLSRALRLDATEAAIFWPIYQEYEQALFSLGDKRFELIKSFAEDYREETLDDEAAAGLASTWFDLQQEQMELLKEYHDKVAAALSPLAAAQFVQLEHRFATVIDLMLASEIPLIESAR